MAINWTISEDIKISPLSFANSTVLREITVLEILSWGREPTNVEIEERTKRLEKEIAAMEPSKKSIFVAKKSDTIVGFSRIARDKNDTSQWWLSGLVVHPSHRRQGIGSALARACIAYAQKLGAASIRSGTHLDNEASIRLHERVGFKNEGRFRASDGDEKIAFSLIPV